MKKLYRRITVHLFALSFMVFAACNNTKGPDTNADSKTTAEGENHELTRNEESSLRQEDLISKGKHLVIAIGCDDCHSPKKFKKGMPEADESLRLSGHPADLKLKPYDQATIKAGYVMTNEHFTAWIGPWGTSFSANITPDKETGIGNWQEEHFFRSIRDGKFHGQENARMLLPPMPWPSYKNLTDEELKAIFAYLKSIPAVRNVVPAAIPPKGA